MKTYWESQAQRIGPMRAAWDEDEDGTQHCLTRLIEAFDSLEPRNRLLDLGCGPGRLAVPLADRYPNTEIVGVDSSLSMMSAATAQENLRFVHNDGAVIPQEIGLLDGAWSVLVFQHIPSEPIRHYLKQVSQLMLRIGGRVVVQYVEGSQQAPTNYHWAANTMQHWFHEAGLTVQKVEQDSRFQEWRWVTAVKE